MELPVVRNVVLYHVSFGIVGLGHGVLLVIDCGLGFWGRGT